MSSANVMSTQANPVVPKSHVGFDSITTQIERKLLKRGFQFNIICVGELHVRYGAIGSLQIAQVKPAWENPLS